MVQTNDDLPYREALQILQGKTCFFTIRKDGNMLGENFLKKQLEYAGETFLGGPSPLKERNRLWLQGRCIYCNTDDLTGYSEGDHIVARAETLDVDLNCYVVPCCKSCNSAKGKKDIFEWWIDKENNNFTELGSVRGDYDEDKKLQRLRDIVGIYVRAEWKWRKESASSCFLDEPIKSGFKTALEQLDERIRERN